MSSETRMLALLNGKPSGGNPASLSSGVFLSISATAALLVRMCSKGQITRVTRTRWAWYCAKGNEEVAKAALDEFIRTRTRQKSPPKPVRVGVVRTSEGRPLSHEPEVTRVDATNSAPLKRTGPNSVFDLANYSNTDHDL